MQTIIQIHFRAQMKLNYNNVSQANPTLPSSVEHPTMGGKNMEIEC